MSYGMHLCNMLLDRMAAHMVTPCVMDLRGAGIWRAEPVMCDISMYIVSVMRSRGGVDTRDMFVSVEW